MASKQWTLTSPDGKCWTGETSVKCVMAEVNERVPASVQLERIYSAAEQSRADDERQCRAAYENTFHKITATIGYDNWRMVWFKALDYEATPPAQAADSIEPVASLIGLHDAHPAPVRMPTGFAWPADIAKLAAAEAVPPASCARATSVSPVSAQPEAMQGPADRTSSTRQE